MTTPVKNCTSVPITSLDGELLKTAGVQNSNGDEYYDYTEAMHLIGEMYNNTRRRNLFPNCAPFDKAQAMKNLKLIRAEMYRKSAVVSNLFGCSSAVMKGFVDLVDHLEKGVIRSYFPIFQQKGVGRIGVGFDSITGEIHRVGSGSAADTAGILKGDKLISVGRVKLSESKEFKRALFTRWTEQKATRYLQDPQRQGIRFTESIVEECFGQCGSTIRIVIERNGRRMTFNLKRGLG